VRDPLILKVDCLRLPVPDLEVGLAFYRDQLGHELIWRSERAAGLRLASGEAELVLQTEQPETEVDLKVASVRAAVKDIIAAGGTVVHPPFEIAIGECAVVQDPWGNALTLLDSSKGLLKTDAQHNVIGIQTDAPPMGRQGGTLRQAELYGGGEIRVRDYDSTWPALFEEERSRLARVLGSLVTTIEHFGSTSVPGQAAKPIIDVLVGVRSLAEARTSAITLMGELGYVYRPDYEAWLPGELFFRKGPPGPWTHHAHVMEPSKPRWEELICLRDYLRRHPEVVEAYGQLKKAIALVFGDDIVGFGNAKEPFVRAVLARAMAERR
jgi:GrpB-like predicted nucleotidyltransferase (UPF0157 family)/predicted enzyme related to lactoylglutathione lyase